MSAWMLQHLDHLVTEEDFRSAMKSQRPLELSFLCLGCGKELTFLQGFQNTAMIQSELRYVR